MKLAKNELRISITAACNMKCVYCHKEGNTKMAILTKEQIREIVEASFGIGCTEKTLEEIGAKYGLSRERVRQIKEKAIRRLRTTTNSKLLKSFLG